MSNDTLDPEVLQRIMSCFLKSQQESSNQQEIFNELQNIVNQVPQFYLYFIHILITPEIGSLHQLLSIISLRRYMPFINRDLLPSFFQIIIPHLLNILISPISPLTSHTAILLTTIYSICDQFAPDFDKILFSLLSKEETLHIGLDCIMELIQRNIPVRIEHFQNLLHLFYKHPESNYVSQFLSIFSNILQGQMAEFYINYIASEILQFIQKFYEKFQPISLSEAMSIVALFYIKNGNECLGDFLIYCIQNLDDLSIDGLYILSRPKKIPFYQPLVVQLFDCLEFSDESFDEVSVSSHAQSILISLFEEQSEVISTIIFPLIQQCNNPGQILRALYIIIDEIEDKIDLNQFFQLAMEHSKDECRGDSILFLCKIAEPDNIPFIIDEFLPLLLDSSSSVRDKVLFSFKELFQEDFESKIEWSGTFYQAFIISVRSNDHVLSLRLAQIIYSFLLPFEKLEGPLFESFFRDIYSLFFSDDKVEFLHASVYLLDILLQKLGIEFSNEIVQIIPRISFALNNDQFKLYSEPISSLLKTMIDLYPQHIQLFCESIKNMAFVFSTSHSNTVFWELIMKTAQICPEFFQSDICEFLITITMNEYNSEEFFDVKLNIMAEFYGILLDSLDPNLIDQLLNATIEIIQSKKGSFNTVESVFNFMNKIFAYKQRNGTLKEEHVQFYNSLNSQSE
ncbi:hypothetical protein TRFO_06345 [Tritrichomonas foetus]|uniref:Importin N-terminal domain-containing protein n=1 Tax=Tritrichomonas foetus TaxID=1144522 RepID=A0A1J4K0G7_9EUKA|nr:hypothetical protein TRFO_06345 [Tritrichomonas foetus]|eukprot:OHT04442.1 hypothetical protein TRFO_06345 [Tritrichomonas foetus]